MTEAQKLAKELAELTVKRALVKAQHTAQNDFPEMKKTFTYKKSGEL
jgi:hypothetical protein